MCRILFSVMSIIKSDKLVSSLQVKTLEVIMSLTERLLNESKFIESSFTISRSETIPSIVFSSFETTNAPILNFVNFKDSTNLMKVSRKLNKIIIFLKEIYNFNVEYGFNTYYYKAVEEIINSNLIEYINKKIFIL